MIPVFSQRLAFACMLGALTASTRPPADGFTVQRLAEGVFATIRTEPIGFYREPNAVFIVGDSDVVVVDAQFSQHNTRDVVAALRSITSKPVRYLVNTHGHDDHVTGNMVWQDAYPGLEIIAHPFTREWMTTGEGARNRARSGTTLPQTIRYFRMLFDSGQAVSGEPITPGERVSYANDTTLMARYVAELPTLRVVPPTLTTVDRITLVRGGRTIEIRFPGRGHSAGDLIVWLPQDSILVTGDLVVAPVPLVGSTSYPRDFARTLSALRELPARIIVPGHGPVLRDWRYVDHVIRLLNAMVTQTEAAAARGETLEQVRRSVDLTDFRRLFTEGDHVREGLFDNYVSGPGVARAFEMRTR